MKRLIVMCVAVTIVFGAAFGVEFTIKDGASDWTSKDSYAEGAVPGDKDVVTIPAGTSVLLDAEDSDSWDVVNGLTRVRPTDATSRMTINVASGAKTLGCALTMRDADESGGRGQFVKTGAGELELTSCGNVLAVFTSIMYDYFSVLVVSNGVLKLPQSKGCTYFVQQVDVAGADAVCYTPNDKAFYTRTLTGSGTITCLGTKMQLVVNGTAAERGEFSGKITGGVRFAPTSGYVDLTGVESDFAADDGPSIATGVLGVKKFGMAGESSSLGTVYRFSVRGNGGTFRWLGTPAVETETDKQLVVWDSPAVLDGGTTGGLTFKGLMRGYDQGTGNAGTTAMMHQLVLAGSNETACVIDAPMTPWQALNNAKSGYTGEVTNYTFHVTKRGTGKWRFAAAKRHLAGAIAVENGTLQFDSVNETNKASALGTASILREPYTGVWDPNKAAAPAFTLGTATTEGALEFTGGDEDVSWTGTRHAVLKGDAKFLNSTARSFRLKGVSADDQAPGAKTLTLGGSGTGENELVDVTDTAQCPIAVVKEGAGTWTLGGNQTVRGGVEVKAGTLRIRRPTDLYRYYKLTVRGILGSYTGSDGKTYSSNYLNLKAISLYDDAATCIPFSAVRVKNPSALCEGGVSYAENEAFAGDDWAFYDGWSGGRDCLHALDTQSNTFWQTCFKPSQTTATGTSGSVRPVESNPTTWVSVVWRLPVSSPAACGYDLAIQYGKYKKTAHIDENIYNDSNGAGQPTSWVLAGSVDGLSWQTLSDVSTNETAFSKNGTWWYAYDRTATIPEDGAHPLPPCPINPRSGVKPSVFADGVEVSVAAGATLEACGEGDDVAIKGLVIKGDAGLGRVNGFSFAENGTIDFTELPTDHQMSYPGALAGCEGLDNVASWSVTKGGQPTTKVSVAVREDGTVTVTRSGLVLIIK